MFIICCLCLAHQALRHIMHSATLVITVNWLVTLIKIKQHWHFFLRFSSLYGFFSFSFTNSLNWKGLLGWSHFSSVLNWCHDLYIRGFIRSVWVCFSFFSCSFKLKIKYYQHERKKRCLFDAVKMKDPMIKCYFSISTTFHFVVQRQLHTQC